MNLKPESIGDMWEAYLKAVHHGESLSAGQKMVMEQSFCGGAIAMYYHMDNLGLEGHSDKEILRHLDDLKGEINDFKNYVMSKAVESN